MNAVNTPFNATFRYVDEPWDTPQKRWHELSKLNNTPFVDVSNEADYILAQTLLKGGGTFIHSKPIPEHNLSGGWNVYEGDGYAVGGYVDTLTFPEPASWQHVESQSASDAIARFIQRLPRNGDGEYHHLLGTWIESDTLYIDAVQVWADIENAIVEGQRLNQHSIYGLNEGEEFVCADYRVEDGEVFRIEDGRYLRDIVGKFQRQSAVDRPEEIAPLDGNLTTIVEEGATFVKLDDVIAELEVVKDSFFRLQQDFASRKSEGDKLNAAQFGTYVNCVEWQIIPALKSRFGK